LHAWVSWELAAISDAPCLYPMRLSRASTSIVVERVRGIPSQPRL
jgi:hypothetical protein